MRIGVIADTHGYLNPHVMTHFAGVDQILHTGDIGGQHIIDALQRIAPVTAVTGNVDWGTPLDRDYRRVVQVEWEGVRIHLTHIGDHPTRLMEQLPDPRPAVYIYGHSHIALIECHDDVLFLNPGAAGKPRWGRQPSVAILHLHPDVEAQLIEL